MYPMTYPRQPSLPILLRRLRDRAVITALALCSALACAGRPLVSETADVIGAGGCELETSVARQVEPNHPKASMADAQFACGLGGHSQLGLLFGGTRSADGTDSLLAFVGKTNLVEPAEGRTGFGLAYSIWTGQDAGESWRHARHSATLGLPIYRLPSTSAANASWSFERKLAAWREVVRLAGLV